MEDYHSHVRQTIFCILRKKTSASTSQLCILPSLSSSFSRTLAVMAALIWTSASQKSCRHLVPTTANSPPNRQITCVASFHEEQVCVQISLCSLTQTYGNGNNRRNAYVQATTLPRSLRPRIPKRRSCFAFRILSILHLLCDRIWPLRTGNGDYTQAPTTTKAALRWELTAMPNYNTEGVRLYRAITH